MTSPYIYNPAFMAPDELIRHFVVRTDELGLLLAVIAENTGPANQHVLVLGGRGLGKSTLVQRVVVEVRRSEALAARIYPIVFPEEAYEVGNIGEFWLEALSRLADHATDAELTGLAAELHADLDARRVERVAREAVRAFATRVGRRVLLVVENLDMLLGDIDESDASALRKTLQDDPTFMLLATALRPFEAITDHNQPFYQGFRRVQLLPLAVAEIEALWTSVAGHPPDRARAQAIRVLSGGNPRMVRLLAELADGHSLRDVLSDLTRLVDQHTDYFKGRIEALEGQQRRVFLALATLWRPATAGEVAAEARLAGGANVASTVLARLERDGRVEVSGKKGKNKLYQVAERLYNIYYLLRRKGGVDARIRALVDFMLLFYAPGEVAGLVQRLVLEAQGPEGRADPCVVAIGELLAAKRLDPEYRAEVLRVLTKPILARIDPSEIKAAKRDPKQLLALLCGPAGDDYIEDAERALAFHLFEKREEWIQVATHLAARSRTFGSIYLLLGPSEQSVLAFDVAPIEDLDHRALVATFACGFIYVARFDPEDWISRINSLPDTELTDVPKSMIALWMDPNHLAAASTVFGAMLNVNPWAMEGLLTRLERAGAANTLRLLASTVDANPEPSPWELVAKIRADLTTNERDAADATSQQLLSTGAFPSASATVAAIVATLQNDPSRALAIAQNAAAHTQSFESRRLVALLLHLTGAGAAAATAAAVLTSERPDDALGWQILAIQDPDRFVQEPHPTAAYVFAAVHAHDRRAWEAALRAQDAIGRDDPTIEEALLRLEGLTGRSDLAVARYAGLVARPDAPTTLQPMLLDLGLTLAAAGQGVAVADALRSLGEVFRPLVIALGTDRNEERLAAEEHALLEDVWARVAERKRARDIWRPRESVPFIQVELPRLTDFVEAPPAPHTRKRARKPTTPEQS